MEELQIKRFCRGKWGPHEMTRANTNPQGRCRECKRETWRRWAAANPEKARENSRATARRWAAAHPEQARETKRRWQEANSEERREQRRLAASDSTAKQASARRAAHDEDAYNYQERILFEQTGMFTGLANRLFNGGAKRDGSAS